MHEAFPECPFSPRQWLRDSNFQVLLWLHPPSFNKPAKIVEPDYAPWPNSARPGARLAPRWRQCGERPGSSGISASGPFRLRAVERPGASTQPPEYSGARRRNSNPYPESARSDSIPMMNHSQVVSLLRQIVTELEPYTSLPLHSTSSTDQGQFGPEASRQSEISAVQGWSKTLEQFAAEVEKHNGPLPERERETIGSNLFGGMGSFTDFYLDERIFGSRAKATNERLMALTHDLYSAFKG